MICLECRRPITGNECKNCGRRHETKDNIPSLLSKEDMENPAFKDYYENYATMADNDLGDTIVPTDYLKAQANKAIKYAGKTKGKAVLDVGVGQGYLLKRLNGCDKTGVDISISFLKKLNNEGIRLIQANAENLPFQNEFDIIFMIDILEHVFNPDKVLLSVYRALKDRGKLVLRVPYKEDISIYKRDGFPYQYAHLRSFDEVDLKIMLEDCGLTIRDIHFDGFSANWKIRHHDLINSLAKAIKGSAEATVIDRYFYGLPNWIGNYFFEPMEIAIVAEKKR